MMQGLEKVSTILPLCKIRENLYLNEQPADSANANISFENSVIELYTHIVEYQASLLCYLSKSFIRRGGRTLFKSDDWRGWLDHIETCFKTCCSYTELFDIDAARRAWKEQYWQASQQTRLQESILEAITTTRNERRMERREEQHERLTQSLSSNYEEQKNLNPKRVAGTCEWFLESDKFRDWRDATDSRILWVSADPGCGKSVLSRCLIDEHRVSNTMMGSTTTYFFFKDGLEGCQKPENALKAILHQLLTENLNTNLAAYVLPRFTAHGEGLGNIFSELWKSVVEISNDPEAGEIVCILDALDECEKNAREKLLASLVDFYSSLQTRKDSSARLKFLITSRPYHGIESKLFRLKGSVNYVHLDGETESDKIAQEINIVIDFKVPEAASNFPQDVQMKLTERLKHMEHRTYLWLYLILDEIESNSYIHFTGPKILKFIENLPATVQTAYEAILHRSESPEKARILLHIILAAKRALTVAELNVAFGLVEQPNCKSYEELDRPSDDLFKSSLRQICGLFVQVYNDDKVYLLHQTARDFLIGTDSWTERWEHSFNPEKSETCIAQVCVLLLCFRDFEDPPYMYSDYRGKGFWLWFDECAFLDYAAQYWITHCVLAQDQIEERILLSMTRLCNTASNRFRSLQWAYDDSDDGRCTPYDSDLIFASTVGLHMVAQILLDRGADVNAKDMERCTALQMSSKMGRETVVRLLLEKGADINTQDGFGDTPLQTASRGGRMAIVKLLLDKGADIDAHGGCHDTALRVASQEGHEAVVQLLLDRGADVNAQCERFYNNALQAASYQGQEAVVQLLLDKGANVNAQGGFHGPALQAASSSGREAVVHLLLNKGANINARGGEYNVTALQAASSHGHEEVAQLLREKGAGTDKREVDEALYTACGHGHHATVKLMLEKGADPNARGGDCTTALTAASFNGHGPVVQLLLEGGADVNAHGGSEDITALQAASRKGHKAVVQLLLDEGADIDAEGGVYGTALQEASMQGKEAIVQLLLDKGADVNAQAGDNFVTALNAAASFGHEKITQMLLDKGADVNVQGMEYGSVLQGASNWGSKAVVQLLLSKGADINTRSTKHNDTAVQIASYYGYWDVVQLLLEKGAEVDTRGGEDKMTACRRLCW